MAASKQTGISLWAMLGLFVAVLTVSVVYHLPAKWALQQIELPPKTAKMVSWNDVRGTLWRGELRLNVRAGEQLQPLGTLQWQLNPAALLWLTLQADLRLENAQGAADWRMTSGVFSPHELHMTDLNGQWALSAVQAFLPANVRALGEIKGQLQLHQMAVSWDSEKRWLQAVSGEARLSAVDLLGVRVPSVILQPSLNGEQLQIAVTGGDRDWRLSGASQLTPKQYQHALSIQADTPAAMPDWVELVMRKTGPTEAAFKQSGRW